MPGGEKEHSLLAVSPTTSDCAVTPLPQSSAAVCVSSVPGSVKLDEMGTVTPAGVRASGVDGIEKLPSDGATFEIVAVVRAVAAPPRPSSTVRTMSYAPLSAYA